MEQTEKQPTKPVIICCYAKGSITDADLKAMDKAVKSSGAVLLKVPYNPNFGPPSFSHSLLQD